MTLKTKANGNLCHDGWVCWHLGHFCIESEDHILVSSYTWLLRSGINNLCVWKDMSNCISGCTFIVKANCVWLEIQVCCLSMFFRRSKTLNKCQHFAVVKDYTPMETWLHQQMHGGWICCQTLMVKVLLIILSSVHGILWKWDRIWFFFFNKILYSELNFENICVYTSLYNKFIWIKWYCEYFNLTQMYKISQSGNKNLNHKTSCYSFWDVNTSWLKRTEDVNRM